MVQGSNEYDIAIIGGGPAGSTCGSLLRKYNPKLRVGIFEKERFPREHIGESQLPLIGHILDEMGAWDKIEAAGFPVKLGATYRWGRSTKLWDFGFVPVEEFIDSPRPGRFEGQRRRLAFQVDRARYDDILLKHAADLGCEVHQETMVQQVNREGSSDRVASLVVQGSSGEPWTVKARYYVDASGTAGPLRQAMGVGISYPTHLRNIAMWDYWENAEWAARIGTGGTRVLVLSIGSGWLWFIPITPTKTSIGFVCPAEYYKQRGLTVEELYKEAISHEPLLVELTARATRHGKVQATRDWSSLADRTIGENWLLCGDSAGFGDPILAAGLMLSHASAREAAYTLLEFDRIDQSDAITAERASASRESSVTPAEPKPLNPQWLRARYDESVRKRVGQHIRFAEYWYSANGIFTDLEEYTKLLAKDAGMKLDPKAAFQWMANGGFTNDVLGRAGMGGVDFNMVMMLAGELSGHKEWQISQFNRFVLNVRDAREETIPMLIQGRIHQARCLVRNDKMLPLAGIYAAVINVLSRVNTIEEIRHEIFQYLQKMKPAQRPTEYDVMQIMQGLEVMLLDGWVWGEYIQGLPRYRIQRASDDDARISCVPDHGSSASRVIEGRRER